jgi:hypothetical protein
MASVVVPAQNRLGATIWPHRYDIIPHITLDHPKIIDELKASQKMNRLYNTQYKKKEFCHLSREAADLFIVLSIIALH